MKTSWIRTIRNSDSPRRQADHLARQVEDSLSMLASETRRDSSLSDRVRVEAQLNDALSILTGVNPGVLT